MKKMFFYFLIISSLALTSRADPKADCMRIHHVDVDSGDYTEFGCFLKCIIHGKEWTHLMAENKTCPQTTNEQNVCQNGRCVSKQIVGFIDVEIATAEVPHKTNAYAEVCVTNSSETQTLPLRNRQSCDYCKTEIIENTAHPVWNKICSGSGSRKWLPSAQITIQVWDKISADLTSFLGGTIVSIESLQKNKTNHEEIKYKLENGTAKDGTVFARITWTQA